MSIEVKELEPCIVDADTSIRVFSMKLAEVTVEVASLGASITRFIVPCSTTATATTSNSTHNDIVLGYTSPLEMWRSKNPVYFSSTVGRVANRIARGQLQVLEDGPVYQLDINNPPNHLHGGFRGFSHCNWEAKIIAVSSYPAVQFRLLSMAGDQRYPGSVEVTATYSLSPNVSTGTPSKASVTLCLHVTARLIDDGNVDLQPTPINLAQHSYFNLAGHDYPNGILDHSLRLNSLAFTPVDSTSVPTRQVVSVADDRAMDWREGRWIGDALVDYGVQKAGLTRKEAEANLKRTRMAPDVAVSGKNCPTPGIPYGFDHNYVIDETDVQGTTGDGIALHLVGVLEYRPARRRLTIRSNAPGVQLYTANYLDGYNVAEPNRMYKDSAQYGQWQGVCLETQHFPDSVLVDSDTPEAFRRGACVILKSRDDTYEHRIEYELEYDAPVSLSPSIVVGDDTNKVPLGQQEPLVYMLWKTPEQRSAWYHGAAQYYEENCPPTVDGVLGGYSFVSDRDLEGSRTFLHELELLLREQHNGHNSSKSMFAHGASCECGAGIGRVTKGLLQSLGVTRCDLVESSARLLNAAPNYLGDPLAGQCRYYCCSLQDWHPVANKIYSIVWIQWVLCYLTDDDVIAFLRRCSNGLLDGGVICIKENNCINEDYVVDYDDSSVTRSVAYQKRLCGRAGLRLVHEASQNDFPGELFSVSILAWEVDTKSGPLLAL